jgi:peptidoglycan hydrolase-like protein with peptidoglycan-binding domain
MKVSSNSHINASNVDQLSNAKVTKVGSFHGHKVSVAAPPAERPASHHHEAPVLREGSRGSEVRHLQRQLSVLGFKPGPVDGIFGPRTEAALKAFQHSRGLSANGVFNQRTNARIDRATGIDIPKGLLREGSRGERVEDLQRALRSRGFNPGPVDGIFGPRTESAVRHFQRSRGIAADGVFGPQTRHAFSRGPVQHHGHSGRGEVHGNGHVQHHHPDTNGNGSISYNGHRVSDPVLRHKLGQIADYFGRHITVTSGDRDYVPQGGSTTSLHLAHRAVDLHVDGLSDAYVFARLRASGILSNGYEVIRHGPFTATGGPHIHIGRYGYNRSSDFKIEGTSPRNRGVYIHV